MSSSQICASLYSEKIFVDIIQGKDKRNVELIRVDKINDIDVCGNYLSLDKIQFKNDVNRY